MDEEKKKTRTKLFGSRRGSTGSTKIIKGPRRLRKSRRLKVDRNSPQERRTCGAFQLKGAAKDRGSLLSTTDNSRGRDPNSATIGNQKKIGGGDGKRAEEG